MFNFRLRHERGAGEAVQGALHAGGALPAESSSGSGKNNPLIIFLVSVRNYFFKIAHYHV
jgi:hypothetical protein